MLIINDKKHPDWKKLQKQKFSYEARLRNRVREETRKMEADQVESVTKTILKMALACMPPEGQANLLQQINKSVVDAESI